jgi:hypothetical protein
MFSLPGRRLDDRWLLLLGGFQVGLRFFHCVPQIIFGHDIVAVEDTASAVPADAHSSFFPDPGAHHVSHCGSSQVVKDAPQVAHIAAAYLALVAGRRLFAAPADEPAHASRDAGRLPCGVVWPSIAPALSSPCGTACHLPRPGKSRCPADSRDR